MFCSHYFPNVFSCSHCKKRLNQETSLRKDIYDSESDTLQEFDKKMEDSFILSEAEEAKTSSDETTEGENEDIENYF
jgi:hypothetical protein